MLEGVELVEEVDASLDEVPSNSLRHVLLLSDFLALETILEIELSEGGHSDAFVSEAAVEELGSLLESEASPLFKSLGADQKVDMFLLKDMSLLFEGEGLWRLESLGAEMLNLVGSEAENSGNDSEGEIPGGLEGGGGCSVAKEKCSLFELGLEVLRQFGILHGPARRIRGRRE